MKYGKGISISLASMALTATLAAPAAAFTCPKRFSSTEAAIQKASAAIKKISGQKKAEAHMLLDDAKMLLASAKHNHQKPQGKMDHARAIAKAGAARGYAEAARILAQN